MDNKGAILLETVISIGFISVILLSSFVVVNSIMNKNSKLYDNQIERRTINSIYSKIANDLYRFNISKYYCDLDTNKECELTYYTYDTETEDVKTLEITSDGLLYDNEKIKNNSAVTFNTIFVEEVTDDVLKLSINYNDNKIMEMYSINKIGERYER